MLSTGWCFLFDIIHSVEREVSCKRQVLFIAFFLYYGIIDYWLFLPVHLSRRGVMDICNLEFTCSCCPYLYFGSAIMLVTYFVNFR